MTASITTLQTGLKATIDAAIDADTFDLPLCVRIADAASSPVPSPDDEVRVTLSFEGSAQLGRSSSKVLDQHLVGCAVEFRHPDDDQQTLDRCHLVMEQLRDVLSEYATATQRVEQILTPHPFDMPLAQAGVFGSKFVLDCDVLRTLHTPTPPTVTDSPRLAAIRGAVWDSIDNWEPFAAVVDPVRAAAWTRKFKTAADVEEMALHDPGLADLPAISVQWGNIGTNWWTHIEQKWPASLNVVFWLPADQLQVAEWRAQQLVQCLYKATGEGESLTYLRAATGYPPEKYSQTIESVELGRGQRQSLRGTIAFTLPATFNPYN